MKVLFYFYPAVEYIHFAIRTELVLQHIKNGDDVHFLFYEEYTEEEKKKDAFTPYVLPAEDASGLINIPVNKRHFVKFDNSLPENIPEFETIDDLKNFMIEDIDIGSAVASTLITRLDEPKPQLKNYKHMIHPMIKNACSLYKSVYETLGSIKPDLFYIFNGRHYYNRPALRAAQKLKTETIVYDKPQQKCYKYIYSMNILSHEIEEIKKQIENCWETYETVEERERIAKSWFTEKREGNDNLSFTKEQTKSKLPDNFDENRMNIGIFNSTESEYEAIPSWKHDVFGEQNVILKKILESVNDSNIHFYLRMHPNLKNIQNSQIQEINSFKYPNLTVIPPESDIDSYSLIDSCSKVVVFRSTIGIEAAYSGKPVILAGRSKYEDLGGCYKPQSYYELTELIEKKELEPLSDNQALKFGYYNKTRAKDLKFFQHENPMCKGFFSFYLADFYYIKGEYSPDKVLKQYFEAYSLFEESEEKEKSNVYLALLVSIFRKFIVFRQDYTSALEFTEKAVSISPNFSEALFTKAFCHQNLGNYEKAIEIFKEMLAFYSNDKLLNPLGMFSDTKSLIPNIYLQIARSLILNDQNLDGRDYLNNAYQLGGNISVLLHLLKYHLMDDDLKNAVPYFILVGKVPQNQQLGMLQASNLPKDNPGYKNFQKSILQYIDKFPVWLTKEREQIILKINSL